MATTGAGGGAGTGGLGGGLTPSVPVQDLSNEGLIHKAPRTPVPGIAAPVPTLGDIPLLAKLGQGGIPLRDQRQKACPKNAGQVLVGILS